MSNKSSGGRPEIPVNLCTAKRVKALRERNRETQKDVGDLIGYGPATVARYEKGERGIGDDIIRILAKHWNVAVDYILGLTDTEDPIAYALETAAAEDAGAAEYAAQQRAERMRRVNFFDYCGFYYEDTHELPGVWEFAGVGGRAAIDADRPHRVSDPSSLIEPVLLTDDELKALLENVHDFIAFECFKLIQQRKEAAHSVDD